MTDKPYDEYVDRVLLKIFEYPQGQAYPDKEFLNTLRAALTDAWLSGLAYSINLIEEEKEKRSAP